MINVRERWGQAGDTWKLKGGRSDLRTVPAKLYVYVLLGGEKIPKELFLF